MFAFHLGIGLFTGWGLGTPGEANSKVSSWLLGDHFASGVDRDCSQHPQCGHERLLPLCTKAGHGVSVSRGGDSLSLSVRVCSGLWEVSWVPLSAVSQPAWRDKAGGNCLCRCHQVSPAVAGEAVICNLSLSLPRGSAWANTVSQYTQAILLFLYVWWKKIHVETWGGTVHSLSLQDSNVWPWESGPVIST